MTARLQLISISKRYGEVVANVDVSLSVAKGSIHALLGENGAGKSTLMKIVYGLVAPDAGSMFWNGQELKIQSPEAARALGISMVFQHFSLFEAFSVAENVWLGSPPGSTLSEVSRRVEELSARYGLALDPARPVHSLSIGEKQAVELARALYSVPELLIMDEPTSVLTRGAAEALFVTLRKLAAAGTSILYISHKLPEIRALCDRCSVLRKGQLVAELDPRSSTQEQLARAMLGADEPVLPARGAPSAAPILRVQKLSLARADAYGVDLMDLSFELRAREIVGIAGMSGSGQAALFAALSGEDARVSRGTIWLEDRDVSRASPVARRALGLRAIPEERVGRGLVPELSLAQNTLLTRREGVSRGGFLRPEAMRALARQLFERFSVRADSPDSPASALSGGNLQKFMVGRELSAEPRVLIVAQPTWGVDVGAAALIRTELLALRERGAAILLISEDLDELLLLSDRLLVMARGRLSSERATRDTSSTELGLLMAGPSVPGFLHA
jgi:simple sugar transport system ATP-binding protein